MASTSKARLSTVPAPPKPPTSLSSSVVIADNASVTGTHLIRIASNTVIHPRTRLVSTYASIVIGSNCILSERCLIGVQTASPNSNGVTIEDGVIVEVGAVVEAERVGTGCVIEVNARIGKGAVLGKVCLYSTQDLGRRWLREAALQGRTDV